MAQTEYASGGYLAEQVDPLREALRVMTAQQRPPKKGDRVRIKEGYEGAGEEYFYLGKSTDNANKVNVTNEVNPTDNFFDVEILAEAIGPYPYTREERIERAIEDFIEQLDPLGSNDAVGENPYLRAVLYAFLDAGV